MKYFIKPMVALFSLIIILILNLTLTQDVSASHFRYGHLSYTRSASDCFTIIFTLTNGFRRSGVCPDCDVGDIFTDDIGNTRLFFGDGDMTPTLRYRVLSVNFANDWLLAIALRPGADNIPTIPHTYDQNFNGLAEINSSARTSIEINHPSEGYRVSALINNHNFWCSNSPQVINFPPVFSLGRGAAVEFDIPVTYFGPGQLYWRYATAAEMGVTGANPWPPFGDAESINHSTGHITWNTSSANIGDLYSTQVIIEERFLNFVFSRVAVDWLTLICFGPTIPTAAVANATLNGIPIPISCDGIIYMVRGDSIAFDARGNDLDDDDPVTLDAISPPGSSWSPPLPLTANESVTSRFGFRNQVSGVYTLPITATDSCGNQAFCNLTLVWQATLPVELVSFESTVNDNNVTLIWTIASEENNARFEIERTAGNTSEWRNIGIVQSSGNSSTQKSYSFADRGLNAGSYKYRLKQVDFNGKFEYHNLSGEVIIGVPTRFDLLQNYPNPFNPTTNIAYVIPEDGNVMLSVYDNSGKLVSSLMEGYKSAGYYAVAFNATDLSSGMYYYKIDFSNDNQSFEKVMKMVVLK